MCTECALQKTYEGDPKKRNYLLEGGPLVAKASLLGDCINVSGDIVVRGCVQLSEFSLKTQCVCPFHDGWFMSTPGHTMLSVQQFLTKTQHDPHAPPFLFTQSHPD